MASSVAPSAGRARARARQSAVEDDVRRLVARELHDRVAQTLTGMLIDLENFKTEQVDWKDVIRQLDTIQDSTRQVLHSLRELLHDLRGEEAVRDSFVGAVGALVSSFEEKTRISAQLTVLPGWPELITLPASINLYRIIEEALANVKMHSGAHEVRIVLQPDSDKEVSVVIGDDGRGLDTNGDPEARIWDSWDEGKSRSPRRPDPDRQPGRPGDDRSRGLPERTSDGHREPHCMTPSESKENHA